MKKQMRRWLAVGIAAVMVLQAAHVENYGSLRQVFAAPESKTQMSTGEIAEPDTSVTTELETGNSIEEAETAENAAAEMLEETAAATSMDGEELQDLSVENGLIEGDYSISVPSRLTGNLVIEGNLNVNQPITLNGYSLVVEGDIIQNRDLVVNGDLIVYGNYQWRDGSLTLEKGYVNIEADMQIFYANGKILSMRQEEDYLLIKGDMLLEASNGLGTDITAGTLELRGDFTQKVYTNGGRMGLPEGDFLMTGNSILLLSGEGRQNIYVSKETSGFEHITVSTANLEKDEEEKYIFGERQIGFSGFYNFKTYEDNGCPTTYGCAEYDEISEEENVIYGSCYYTGEPLHLKKRNLTFTGDFIQNADVCLEGGRLEIYGDYRIQSVQGKEQFGETEGIIDCSGGGYVYVYGDFVTQSLADHTGYLDAGTWYFYSNLCQIGKNAKNFVTSDSFKIYWNYVTGESEERHIIMDNPLENPIVYLYNYTKDDFVFDNGVCIDQFLCGRPYSGMLYLRTDKAAGTYQGDVTIVSPAALTSYLTVEGNLTVQADVTVQTLVTVKKNVDVEHGVLTFESGAALDAGNVSFTDGSDSALRMEKEAAYIRCDNFYYGSNCSSESLTNGEINVTDDFYVKDTGTPDSFVCSENHRVVASGSNGVQTITIESPESCLETLVVSNGNGGMTRSTEGTVIHSIQNKSYSYMWEGIEGYTLEQDVVYDGDLILCGGVLDLNGHTLTVKGDFYAEGGTIHVNGGHLIVNGSLKCVYRDWADGEIRLERSNVDIIMDNDNDRMDVTGDWYAIFITHSLKNMTAGTVHLSGNMNIEGSVGSDYAAAVETILNGSSLWLEGTEKQSVTGISKNIQMKINDLVVTNEKEIEIELPFQIDGMLQLPENLKYQFYELTIQNLDNLSGRIFKGNLTAKQSTLSGDVTIDGNLSIKGKTDLCGYHISAKEITVDAETTLSGGGLHVDTLYMNHKIIMQNPADVIEAKDMNVQVKISDSDYMTDGNIYITGDFKDISSYYSNSQQTYAFLPTENHTITFMKPDSTTENKASITFYGQASKLNRVILENKLNCYTLNREKEDIANELILNYEDNEKPTSPQNITCTRKNCYSVDLKWEESEDNMEVYRYKIYRNGQYIGKTGDNAYTDAILKSNMNYRYSLTAVDGAGNESDMSQVLEVATPDDENAPDYSNAPEFEVKGDSVSINCNNTYADKENYVDYYIITKDGEEVARVLENSYVSYKNYKNETITKCVHLGRPYYSETGLEYGKNYTYGIVAVDAAGNRSEEYVKNVTADLPPTAPEQFFVVSENGYNTISFEKSGNPGCSSYKLYRGGTCITTFTNNSNVTAYYVDKNVKAGCSYQYYIVPYNKYGTEGEKTETFSVITIADKTPPVIENVSYSIPGDIFNEEVDICVTASDNSGISSIYAYLEKEGEENTEIYRVTFGEYAASCSEDFTLAVDGRKGIYDLHVVAVDHCGNETEEVKACRIQIAGIAPVKALPVETDAASVSLSWEPVEEAAYYVVEQKTGSTYERVGRTSADSLTVSQLECDRKYSFRIAAYDKDGVRGLATDDITAVTLPDTTNPAISKVYGNDSIFGISSLLEIGYWDDHKVKKVSAFYRPKGTSDWILIGEQQVNRRTGTCYMSWDKTGLKSEGYDVLYQAEDSSGNLSEELILTYTLDLEGPVLNNLSLIPKDWAIRLEWDEIKDADYSGFRIQRVTKSQYDTAMEQGQDPFQNAAVIKQGSKNHFFEEEISPKEEYVYQLSLYDGYGNVTTSTVSGQAVDNDVKSPEMDGLQPLFAARDVAVSLSAGECRDNDGIASYQWDMGNGDIIYGANCEYTYKKIGCYQLTLTVLDPSGNSSSSTTTVTVGEDIGTVKVTVMSEGKALPDADVVLCMNSQPCHSGVEPQTNSQGKLTMPVSEGTYQIAAYKAGYVPASEEITVTAGETKEVIICLKKGDSIQASFTTKEMTFEEMKKAGIDTEANKVVFQYNINLEFEKGKIGSMTMNSTKPVVTCYLSGGTFNPLPGDLEDDKDDKDDNKTSITVQNISDDPSKPVFTLTQIKPVEISWLKNIYEVEVTIINQAEEEFRLEDAKARLNLPDGLELANMKNEKKNSSSWKIGTLKGGEQKTHTWYVGGNKTGSYSLEVELDAILQPFNMELHKTLTCGRPLEVTVGKGLHLYIYPENTAYIGEYYYIQFQLKNESGMDYHYVTTNFGNYHTESAKVKNVTVIDKDGVITTEKIGIDTEVNYYDPSMGNIDSGFTLQTGDTLSAKLFKARRVLYGTFMIPFNAEGDIEQEYYRLLTKYVNELEVNNTNVEVTIAPIEGHLTKTFQKRTIRTQDPIPDPTPTPTDDTVPNTDSSSQSVKDPINLMTGAFTVQHVIAAVSGGTNLSFELNYNSLYTETSGELGRGWYHNYEMNLERNGAMVILYQNPYEMLYFTESEETANTVCGTVDGNTIILGDDSAIERTYYQAGTASKKYRITKNKDGYVLFTDREQYTFDTEGKLTGYRTEDGKKVTVKKTEDTMTITDKATGKTITAFYNEQGRITGIADAAGKKTTLSYDGDCMTVLNSKNGESLIYEYDEQGHILKGKEGKETVYVENTYDDEGRVLTQVANGKKEEITNFAYSVDKDAETTTITMTNADGTTEQAVADRFGQGIKYVNAIGGVKEYQYNSSYEMTSCHYPDGTGKSYSYDKNGNITEIAETTGKTTSYTYDRDNRVTHMVCNNATDITYTYNEDGQVHTMTSGNGLKAVYAYNEDGQVLTEQSALGTMTYHYEKGMLKALEDYSGNTHSFAYDANGNVTQYVDGNGIVTDYKLDLSGRVLSETVNMEDGSKASVSYTYDAYSNVLTKTDALGNTTGYTYDEEDRISAETRPDGSKIRYEYDVNGNITKITMPDGETKAEAVYDAAGNTLSLVDTLGNIKNASYSAGSQLLSMTQGNGGTLSFTYYENGLLESQTDANGNTLTISYDEAGRVIQTADAEGNTTGYEYDRDGNLCKVEDALGNSTEIGYNEYRKVASQKDANGNITTYDYDKALNCIRVTDAEQGVTEFSYDANGQIKSMTKKGETKEQDITLSMTYDNLGNVTSLTDGEGNVRKMEYGLNSNLTAVYDAKGVKTAAYTYDEMGNQKTAADAFGNVTENTYDSFGNLVKQMNEATGAVNTYSYVGGKYLAGSTDALENTASMTYDSMGNVETLTNPNGGVTTYQYDLNNNLTDEIIGEDYHVRYTYNAWNLAATKTNSRGQETSYSYDALGRLVHQEDEAGIIDYTYDANGNVLTITETIGTTVNTITRTYDGLNRVTSYEDAKGNKTGYEYDKTGNLVKLTYPNGKAVTYTYDKNCNIKTVTDWKNRTTAYSYDENGRLVKTERPNKTVETRGYDKAGQLILILDKCGDTEVNRQEYCYDAAGNITEVKQLYNGELDFTDVTTAKMTYDKNNRLLTYNDEKVEYDKDGNMVYGPLQGRMTQFVFDCRNRLVKAGDTSYEYDAENNRIAVTTGAKRTEYVVNSQPELSQVLQSTVTDGEREETTYYFYGKGLISQENVTGGYLTYHFNNVGSTMAVTDENGAVRYSYHYSPYGELLEGEYSENVPFLYNGQYGVATDGNGLYYMRARYYNVDVKRFVNQDVVTGTLERISSLNRYAYVEGNPVSYLDPFGLAKSIYDEWHEVLEEMMIANAKVSVVTSWVQKIKIPQIEKAYMLYGIISSVVLASIDIGVCIGRAWEGVYESDYNKIDTSYEMLGEAIENFVLTVSSLILDNYLDFEVSGKILDAISWLKDYSKRLEEK